MPASAPGKVVWRQASSEPSPSSHYAEFEAPTSPRARMVSDSEPPTALRPSEAARQNASQDSFHPMRVPPRTVHPPLPFWKRAWASAALVIMIVGGAIGIVASLRGRVFFAGSRPLRDRAPAAAAPAAAAPAAPGYAVPPPAVPAAAAPKPIASTIPPSVLPPVAIDALPTESPVVPSPPRSSANAVAARPRELTVSPPTRAVAARPWTRSKAEEPAPRVIAAPRDETAPHAPPAPPTSDLPGTKGEPEAWVTEERRF